MLTVRALWAQRRKWDEGMIRLLLGTKVGAATVYPWRMQLKMGLNAVTRVMFVVLLTASLAVGAFHWSWSWIVPPILGAVLNLKHARKIPGRTGLDLLLAATLIGVELYLWFRLAVWLTSWATVIAGIRRDGWARQYKAEGLPVGQTVVARGEVSRPPHLPLAAMRGSANRGPATAWRAPGTVIGLRPVYRLPAMRRLLAILLLTLLSSMSCRAAEAASITPPLSTSGSQIVDATGHTAVLQGVNWFGFETSAHVVHGLWKRDYRDVLAQVRRLGFNTIRLPFSLQALGSPSITGVDFSAGKNAALRNASPLRAMDVIVDEAARQGLLVILDCHSGPDDGYTQPLWYGQGHSEQDWVDAWKALARRFRDRPNVVGADLKNEPHGEATWGTGGPTDWRRAATRAGDAVLSVAPDWLILVEGIGGPVAGELLDTHWWGGNLQGVRRAPVRLSVPHRLVYSPHEHGPGVFNQPWFQRPDMARVLADRWHKEFGFILEQGVAPLLVGEFGGRRVDAVSAEGRWQRQFLDYLGRTGISWTYWALNPNSGDTGGVLTDDWSGVDRPKMELLVRLIQRRRTEGGAGGVTPRRPDARRPARRPAPRPPARPVASARDVAVREDSRWSGGSCAHLVVSGPDGDLGSRSVTLDIPAGTSIKQTWNGVPSGATGRAQIALPAWARIQAGSPYTATGFCLTGPGTARVAPR